MSNWLIAHKSVLAGLSMLIPIPFVDGAVKQAVQRSLVRGLASEHGVSLSPRSIAILADDESTPLLKGLATKVMLMPVRWALRRAVIVLSIKAVSDAISDVYHRGLLYEHAFLKGYATPAGEHSSADIRKAVDAVCEEVTTAPVERAIRAGLEPYKNALTRAATVLRGQLARERDPRGVEATERATAATESASAGDLVDAVKSLMAEIGEVPTEYFDELRARLDARLETRRAERLGE